MARKPRRMIEGLLYLLSLPRGVDKATVSAGISEALKAANCGRVLGSGISLVNDGTICVEVGAYDCDAAKDAISRVCRRLKCLEFEVAWD